MFLQAMALPAFPTLVLSNEPHIFLNNEHIGSKRWAQNNKEMKHFQTLIEGKTQNKTHHQHCHPTRHT